MDWDALGAIGELLAAVGVIISLVYLALQISQNTRSQHSENYGRAVDRVTALQARLSENAELADILLRGVQDASTLTVNERIQFTWMFYEMFSGFEFIFHQAQTEALPAEVWQRWGDTLRWWTSFPGVQTWWRSRPSPFTPDFTVFVDRQIALGVADPGAQSRWARFLANGRIEGN